MSSPVFRVWYGEKSTASRSVLLLAVLEVEVEGLHPMLGESRSGVRVWFDHSCRRMVSIASCEAGDHDLGSG